MDAICQIVNTLKRLKFNPIWHIVRKSESVFRAKGNIFSIFSRIPDAVVLVK